ncbi:hypothetical protein ACIBUY_34065 [Streptomyces sp. NPDC050085]|uniref:hypothetical protein n=1 Tax=Streptomyces sp. NPDC050085 TaxID=3365600 RepID=UPI003790F03C
MTNIPALSLTTAAVALIAAGVAYYNARATSARSAFELARTLYSDLTSQDVAASRSILEFYRRAPSRTGGQTKEAIDHYFVLLWQFEKVYAGRESLVGQRTINGTGGAIAFLDRMIKWHVEEWSARWLDIRAKLEAHIDEVDDCHTLEAFCDLADSMRVGQEHVPAIREVIQAARDSQVQTAGSTSSQD